MIFQRGRWLNHQPDRLYKPACHCGASDWMGYLHPPQSSMDSVLTEASEHCMDYLRYISGYSRDPVGTWQLWEWYGMIWFLLFLFCFFSIMGILLGLLYIKHHQAVILLRQDREDFHEAQKPNCSFFSTPPISVMTSMGFLWPAMMSFSHWLVDFFCRGLKKPLKKHRLLWW